MPFLLPVLEKEYDQSSNLQIADQTYTFRYKYNATEDAWYCYIGLVGETPKVKFKLVNGVDLLAPWQAYDEVPKGVLFIIDQDAEYGRAGKDNFYTDGRFFLLFFQYGEDISELVKLASELV